MSTNESEREALAAQVRAALQLADKLQLHRVAIALDMARVELDGPGSLDEAFADEARRLAEHQAASW